MVTIGTPLSEKTTKMLLLGSGELGREVAIEAIRLGVEVIAVDRYHSAPAMQVAHRSYVASMLDPKVIRDLVERERPDFIVPEIEAIATDELVNLEKEGWNVVPTARATRLTMNREGIRRLAAEELQLKTSPYLFAENREEFEFAVNKIGFPCVVKPVMSSSGHGQSIIRSKSDMDVAWTESQTAGRAGAGKVIVEGFIDFDYEITQLTVRHVGGTSFCEPIGHYQKDGDYRRSWQPQPMSESAQREAQRIAGVVTKALAGDKNGWGIYGVELFIKGDNVYFSEVSPRPHDTGLVTLISQNYSEFALHVRAILGLPIPLIRQYGPAASAVIRPSGKSNKMAFHNVDVALSEPDTSIFLFGKPEINGERRLGVVTALGNTIDNAKDKAQCAADAVEVEM